MSLRHVAIAVEDGLRAVDTLVAVMIDGLAFREHVRALAAWSSLAAL